MGLEKGSSNSDSQSVPKALAHESSVLSIGLVLFAVWVDGGLDENWRAETRSYIYQWCVAETSDLVVLHFSQQRNKLDKEGREWAC